MKSETGRYTFKTALQKNGVTAELIWEGPPPDAEAFDDIVQLFREKFPELGEYSGEEEKEKNPEDMDQKTFERWRSQNKAKRF